MGKFSDKFRNWATSDEYDVADTEDEIMEEREIPSQSAKIRLDAAALELKVVKPDKFESVPQIADHLLSHRTIVLNLENADKDTSRRILDFLSGVAYSVDGHLKKIANCAYVITPDNVDISGEKLKAEVAEPEEQPAPEQGETYNV